MDNSEKSALITPAYLERFHCLADQCEDHCCHGWRINVDKQHYQRLKYLYSADQNAEKTFNRCVALVEQAKRTVDCYATFNLNAHNECSFLDAQGLCFIQKQHGADCLPDGCRLYPRKQFYNGGRVEMYGALSCPEIARLCLLAEDAFDPVEKNAAISPQYVEYIPPNDASYYQKYNVEVRSWMIALLEKPTLSLSERLILCLYFAQGSVGFFHKTTVEDPGQSLQNLIETLNQPDKQQDIFNQFNAPMGRHVELMDLLLKLLSLMAAKPFAADIIHSCFGVDIRGRREITTMRSPQTVYQLYQENVKTITSRYDKRITLFFTHYAMNFWLSNWFCRSDNLFIHFSRFAAEMALLKFMFFQHKDIIVLAGHNDIDENKLDKAAVEVFYRYSRTVEHDSVLRAKMDVLIQEMLNEDLPLLLACIQF